MVEIPLTRGLVAIIDDADLPAVLAAGKWTATVMPHTTYARRRIARPDGRQGTLYLHTFLTGWPRVDHRNRDGLDNRRANLRPATCSQNSANTHLQRNNTSGYRGVTYQPSRGLYAAQITVNRHTRNLGRYADPADAARAYDTAARNAFGEYAALNFPKVTA